MIGQPNYSQWGIKSQGEDITHDILDMVHMANSFIVIGGYNFSFVNAGQTFFNKLRLKASQGVSVLMIFPPNLFGPNNPQPTLINYCINNNIGVMLSYQNHSKWLLTENSIYYGSSNFSPTSWRQKIEVVTMHNHSRIPYSWANETVQDFRLFIQREINSIHRRRTMNNYPGLITNTRNTWASIRTQILRLNPSIEKVKTTLGNYENVQLELMSLTQDWFYNSNFKDYKYIYLMNNLIMNSINTLCEFAYGNIVNESIEFEEITNEKTIVKYNELHSLFSNVIEENLTKFNNKYVDIKNEEKGEDELLFINLKIVETVSEKIKTAPNNGYS